MDAACVLLAVDIDERLVFVALAEGLATGPGRLSAGKEGAGCRTSVYISRRIFDRPIMADGWSAL